jgi:glycine cleavage system aminomethyltransferase T
VTQHPEPQVIPHAFNVPMVKAAVYRQFGANSYIPAEYTDFIDESMSWKTTCYIGDWSPLWKLMVCGRDAGRFFSDISVNSFKSVEVGQGKHLIFCTLGGKVTGDGVLMRLDQDRWFYQSGPGAPWAQFMFDQGGYDATCTNVTADHFIFQVSGPNSLFVLEKATGESLRDIGFMRFRETRIGGMPFYALRQGMAGELGYELHGSSLHGRAIYQAILDAGQEFGIRRLGSRTLQVNHVEACFPTSTVDYTPAMHGPSERDFFNELRKVNSALSLDVIRNAGSYEIAANSDMYRSPVELGWSKSIKFDHEFLGRQVLAEEIADPRRTMVTLIWNSEDVVDVYASLFRKDALPPYMEVPRHYGEFGMWADSVMRDGQLVGVSTSRCYSVYFREMISLCVIDIASATPGVAVEVLWGKRGSGQKRIRAIVAPAPYKRDGRKIDVNALPSYL